MFKTDTWLMVLATLLLVAGNWLAFHDVREAHTVRDWVMLLATVLVLIQFGSVFWQRAFGHPSAGTTL